MTKIAVILAIVAASTTTTTSALAMPPAGQAAQPGWSAPAVRAHVVPRGAQVGQAAQPGSWLGSQRTRTHVYANAGVAHGQAAQPGWSSRH